MSRGKPSGHAWVTGALELNSEQSVKERKMRGRPSRWPAVGWGRRWICGKSRGLSDSYDTSGRRSYLIQEEWGVGRYGDLPLESREVTCDRQLDWLAESLLGWG